MGKIVAIGGGEIGRPGYPVETLEIDKEIIKLTGKKRPGVLFIPTASSDSELYVETVKKHFGKRLGCKVDVLYLVKEDPSKKSIREQILNSDIIYVGGGNTLKMMQVWRKKGVDKILEKAYRKGIVISGLSAGAICWFSYGSSDSRQKGPEDKSLCKVRGMGLIDAGLSPHHLQEPHRKKAIKDIMAKTSGVAIALDDYSAIEIVDDIFRIITSKRGAKAHKVYRKLGKVHYEKIDPEEEFTPLEELLSKD